jgi:hypothetical protein
VVGGGRGTEGEAEVTGAAEEEAKGADSGAAGRAGWTLMSCSQAGTTSTTTRNSQYLRVCDAPCHSQLTLRCVGTPQVTCALRLPTVRATQLSALVPLYLRSSVSLNDGTPARWRTSHRIRGTTAKLAQIEVWLPSR